MSLFEKVKEIKNSENFHKKAYIMTLKYIPVIVAILAFISVNSKDSLLLQIIEATCMALFFNLVYLSGILLIVFRRLFMEEMTKIKNKKEENN